MSRLLTILFFIELALIGLIIVGVVPRNVSLYWAGFVAVLLMIVPLEDGVVFFVRSIPLCIALPLTATFDSFNMWRIFVSILFLKWLLRGTTIKMLWHSVRALIHKPFQFMKEHRALTALFILFVLACVSLTQAVDVMAGIKRIVYFINLSLVAIVIYDLVPENERFRSAIIRSIAIATIIATVAGFAQLASTYFIDVYQFMRLWGEVIDLNLFGSQWSQIAIYSGNTWLAYFGQQLSLRMFSIFPDSHSFPMFILLGLPAVIAISKWDPRKTSLWRALVTKRPGVSIFIPFVLLAAILSGTRGIWAAGGGMILWVGLVWLIMKKRGITIKERLVFRRLSAIIVMFVLLFGVAYPIIASKQFRVPKDASDLIIKRIRSIIDFGETSNSLRLEIWKATVRSIAKRPLLGVGIYNFPTVLNQKVFLSKAGSSAHNIYLHIAAEMGIPALIVALYAIFLFVQKIYNNFTPDNDIYFGALLITVPWVLLYSLTDFALFDERTFLLFLIAIALTFSQTKTEKPTLTVAP